MPWRLCRGCLAWEPRRLGVRGFTVGNHAPVGPSAWPRVVAHTRSLFQALHTMQKHLSLSLAILVLSLSACASKGHNSSSAQPVFYPNAKLQAVGQERARQDAGVCMDQARAADLSPEENDNAVVRGAEKGAAVGGVVGAVGALVRGRGIERVVEQGAAGAVVGGSAGAVSGAFHSRPSSIYRHFVQRCLKDKGYDVIGWN